MKPISVLCYVVRRFVLPAAVSLALTAPAAAQRVRAETLARGLQYPWSIAFLPDFERDGRVLVTERRGKLRIVTLDLRGGGRARIGRPIGGVPRVDAAGQGGLLDVALDPKFADNGLVYLSYSEPASAGASTSAPTAPRWHAAGSKATSCATCR